MRLLVYGARLLAASEAVLDVGVDQGASNPAQTAVFRHAGHHIKKMLLVFVTRYDDGIYYVKIVLIKHNLKIILGILLLLFKADDMANIFIICCLCLIKIRFIW